MTSGAEVLAKFDVRNTMTDHDALLAAICEHHREDTPRLVYADWLDENADTWPTPSIARLRASFIRAQITIDQLDPWDATRVRYEITFDARNEHTLAWSSSPGNDLGRFNASHGRWFPSMPSFRRGFPHLLGVVHPESLFDQSGNLLQKSTVEQLLFVLSPPDLHKLTIAKWFSRLLGLGFRGGRYTNRQLAPIIQDPPPDLTALYFASGALANAATVGALFTSPVFGQLTTLAIRDHAGALGGAILDALTALSPNRLQTLDLSKSLPGVNGLQMLAARGLPQTVRILDVSGTNSHIDPAGTLAESTTFANLKILNFSSNPIGNAGSTALFTSPHLTGLKVLDLSHSMVGDVGLRALLASPFAEGLVFLNLTGSPASADMKQAVKNRMGDRVRI